MKAQKAFLAIISVLILFCTASYGQQYAITSAGNHSTANGHQLTWSLGQVSNISAISNNIYLGAGIHNGEQLITILSGQSKIEQQITIYPNPVSDFVSVSPASGPYKGSYSLINTLGKVVLVKDQVDFSNKQIIDMQGYTVGNYILRVNLEGEAARHYKIIKN